MKRLIAAALLILLAAVVYVVGVITLEYFYPSRFEMGKPWRCAAGRNA